MPPFWFVKNILEGGTRLGFFKFRTAALQWRARAGPINSTDLNNDLFSTRLMIRNAREFFESFYSAAFGRVFCERLTIGCFSCGFCFLLEVDFYVSECYLVVF